MTCHSHYVRLQCIAPLILGAVFQLVTIKEQQTSYTECQVQLGSRL